MKTPLLSWCAALALLSFLVGCEGWKKADSVAGAALTPSVGRVRVAGRDVIRLHSKTAVVLVDPRGGAVVDYHLELRPRGFWVPDPHDADRMTIHPATQPAVGLPNVLAEPGWRTVTDPPTPTLDRQMYWQTDVGLTYVELISDAENGLRWRKVFDLADDGSLNITAALTNTTRRPIEAGAAATIATQGPVVSESGFQRSELDGQLFVRQLTGAAGTEDEGYRFPKRVLRPNESLTWTERWTLRRTGAATQPATQAAP